MCTLKIATPEKSSASDPGEVPAARADLPAVAPLGGGARAALLALNTLPLWHGTGVILLLALPTWPASVRLAAATAALWLLPPLACRLVLAWSPITDGRHAVGSRVFWSWWVSLQWQSLFLRLPFLEEILRLVPGAYSAWLRLWGARVGRLTYWSPGVEITDRPLLEVGDDVVLGGRARLGAHVLRRTPDGQLELITGRIRIGNRCSVGAQSTLGPGVRLADHEFTHAFFLAPPFSHWQGGRRIRTSDSSAPSRSDP